MEHFREGLSLQCAVYDIILGSHPWPYAPIGSSEMNPLTHFPVSFQAGLICWSHSLSASMLLITVRIVVYTAVRYKVLHSAVQVQLFFFLFAELPLKLA